MRKPLGEEMEFFQQYNEVLFNQLEKKILDLETANQQLRILAKEYQLQFKNISDVVFMIGTDFNILNISPSVEKLLGYKAEDFIGRHVSDLRHIFTSESFERATANISRMLKDERIPATIYTFVAKDGTLKHIEINGSPLIRNGQVAGTISVARDITERKLMEEKLRDKEQRFHSFVEHSSDIIVLLNLEGGITYINPAVESVLGFKPEERIGANGFELVHPDDMKLLADSFNTLVRDTNSPVIKVEMRLRHKDGSWRTLKAVGSNFVRNNVVESVIVNYRDITERKLVHEYLYVSEERFRLLSEASFEAVAIHEEGVLLHANDQYFKMFGYEPEEALGQEMISVTFAPESLEFVKKRLATDSLKLCEAIGIRKDGTRFPMEIHTRKMEYKGRTVQFGAIRDITERKRAEEELRESEEKYRELVKYAPAGIYEFDYETNLFISVNDVICEYTGYTKDELLTMNFFNILTEKSQKLMLARLEKLMANEKIPQTVEYCIRTKGEEELWVRLSARYIYESEKLKGSTGVVYNITDHKQAEEALRESENKYRELSIIDDLTQLYNSKHFHAQLEIEIERSNSYFYGQPLTLLLLDLDKFKAFNDTYGHIEGDYVLSRFGQVIKRCLRETDSAYRYGGREISIMLPMTAIEEGIVKAKRIQAELRKETFPPVLDQNINMTVSIGLAQYKPMEEMKMFVHRVEKLMYQAKKDGRDRICPDRSRHKRRVIG